MEEDKWRRKRKAKRSAERGKENTTFSAVAKYGINRQVLILRSCRAILVRVFKAYVPTTRHIEKKKHKAMRVA